MKRDVGWLLVILTFVALTATLVSRARSSAGQVQNPAAAGAPSLPADFSAAPNGLLGRGVRQMMTIAYRRTCPAQPEARITVKSAGELSINGVSLGMASQDVVSRLGPPASKSGNVWLYSDGTAVTVESGRVQAITGQQIRDRRGIVVLVIGQGVDDATGLKMAVVDSQVVGPGLLTNTECWLGDGAVVANLYDNTVVHLGLQYKHLESVD